MYKGDKEVYVKFNWKSKAEGQQYFATDKDAQMAGKHCSPQQAFKVSSCDGDKPFKRSMKMLGATLLHVLSD